MSVTYLIEFRVAPGQRDRFLELLNPVLDAMRHEASFRSATLSVDPDDPARFLLHETWASHDDVVAVQVKRPYRAEWHRALHDVLAEPRRIGIWSTLRADCADRETIARTDQRT